MYLYCFFIFRLYLFCLSVFFFLCVYCYLDILSVSKISDCLLIGVLYVQAIKINKKKYIYTARSLAFISRSREVLSRPLAPARFYPARSREVLSRPLPRGFIPPARSLEVLSHPLAPRFYPARSREVLSRPLQRGFYPARSREVLSHPLREVLSHPLARGFYPTRSLPHTSAIYSVFCFVFYCFEQKQKSIHNRKIYKY